MDKHPWRVGDLCACTYGDRGCGIVYRVTKVRAGNFQTLLDVVPIFGLLQDIEDRRPRKSVVHEACKPLSLIDLGTEYLKFGNMIAEEAKRRGAVAESQD